jgi:hypothetical protein
MRLRSALVVAALCGSAAIAQSAHASTHYYIVRAAECAPSVENGNEIGFSDLNGTLWNNASKVAYLSCEVDLPDDATITKFTGYGLDDSSTNHMTMRLLKALYSASTATTLASVQSNSSTGTWSSDTLSESVSNAANSYFITIYVPSHSVRDTFGLFSLEVKYTRP